MATSCHDSATTDMILEFMTLFHDFSIYPAYQAHAFKALQIFPDCSCTVSPCFASLKSLVFTILTH